MGPSQSIRVMLVDDHTMVRRGLATFLKVFDDLELAGEADSGGAAITALAFNSHGDLLASGNLNGAVRLWQLESGLCLQTFRISRPYEQMDITGATGLSESQKAMLRAFGAIENP